MKISPPKNKYPKLHRDGTISYWSYYSQDWIERAIYVPAEEIEAMEDYDRERVRKHLGYAD